MLVEVHAVVQLQYMYESVCFWACSLYAEVGDVGDLVMLVHQGLVQHICMPVMYKQNCAMKHSFGDSRGRFMNH